MNHVAMAAPMVMTMNHRRMMVVEDNSAMLQGMRDVFGCFIEQANIGVPKIVSERAHCVDQFSFCPATTKFTYGQPKVTLGQRDFVFSLVRAIGVVGMVNVKQGVDHVCFACEVVALPSVAETLVSGFSGIGDENWQQEGGCDGG